MTNFQSWNKALTELGVGIKRECGVAWAPLFDFDAIADSVRYVLNLEEPVDIIVEYTVLPYRHSWQPVHYKVTPLL